MWPPVENHCARGSVLVFLCGICRRFFPTFFFGGGGGIYGSGRFSGSDADDHQPIFCMAVGPNFTDSICTYRIPLNGPKRFFLTKKRYRPSLDVRLRPSLTLVSTAKKEFSGNEPCEAVSRKWPS